jgi:glucose/arabinose dehydrogenase
MGGSLLWNKSPKTDLYSSIWRVRPDGRFRRIYLARKLRKSGELADGLGGLALDAQGRIVFGAGNLRGHGWRILRLDEATGRTSVLAGSASDADTIYADGPAMQARFHTIRDLGYAPDGTLFVNDANHVIRKITPDGQVTTWAF